MKKTLYFLICLISFGCTKEKIIEKEYRWKAHSNFIYTDATILNSHATFNFLYLMGRSFYSLNNSTYPNSILGGNTLNYLLNGKFNIDQKLPINDLFYVNYNEDVIIITPTKNPVSSGTDLSMSIRNLDKSYGINEFSYYTRGECIQINDENQILIPYKTFVDSITIGSTISLLIANVDVKHGTEDVIDTTQTKIIKLTDEYNVNNVFTYNDYFIITMTNTFKIKSNGTYSKVFNGRLEKVFQKNDILYGIGLDKYIYKSIDQGETWASLDCGEIKPDLLYLNYYNIDNEIIATHFGQLFHLVINDDILTFKEIDNDGLIDNYITSISKYKGKIYVTTLTGVYFLEAKDFYTYKAEK